MSLEFYNARLCHIALIPIFEINESGKGTQPDTKNRNILSKILFFATFTGFCRKRHFYKRVYDCVTASILLLIRTLAVNYNNPIFMQKTRILAVMSV